MPYESPPEFSRDAEHLRLLALFHYIVGGIIMVLSSCAIVHLVMGIVMLVNPAAFRGPPGSPPPPGFLGALFTMMGSVVVIGGWTIGILAIFSGRCIAGHRRRMFSLIIAGILCLWMPFGTVLGVFTFIVLLRPSIEAMYGIRRR